MGYKQKRPYLKVGSTALLPIAKIERMAQGVSSIFVHVLASKLMMPLHQLSP